VSQLSDKDSIYRVLAEKHSKKKIYTANTQNALRKQKYMANLAFTGVSRFDIKQR
jgi:hypothetical protein